MGSGSINLPVSGGGTSDAFFDNGNISGSFTIDWSKGNYQRITLTGNANMTAMAGISAAGAKALQVVQGGAGGYTLAYPPAVAWPSQTPPTLTTTFGRYDNLIFLSDGITISGNQVENYKPYNPNFRPSDISGLILWLDGADASSMTASGGGTPVNGNTISQWNDKSGQGHNAVQATTLNQFTYNTAVANGHSALTCANPNLMTLSGAASGTFLNTGVGFTYVLVMKRATLPGTPYFGRMFNPVDQNGHYMNLVLEDDNDGKSDSWQFADDGSGNWAIGGFTPFGGALNIVTLQYNGTGSTSTSNFALGLNGSPVVIGAGTAAGSGGTQAIGGISTTSSAANFNGIFYEICIYNNDISSGDLASLITYLQNKWA